MVIGAELIAKERDTSPEFMDLLWSCGMTEPLVLAAGAASLASMATFVGALAVLGVGARRHDIRIADLAPPHRASTLSNFAVLRQFYWPAVWLAVASIPLMAIVPLGLLRLTPDQEGLSETATILYFTGLVFGSVHVGLQSVAQTSVAWRYVDATGPERPWLLTIATTLYDANDFFEARGAVGASSRSARARSCELTALPHPPTV